MEETKPNWFVEENIKFLGNQVHFCDQNLSYASSLRKRHFESSKQGETNSRNGDATKTINPKKANPATTWEENKQGQKFNMITYKVQVTLQAAQKWKGVCDWMSCGLGKMLLVASPRVIMSSVLEPSMVICGSIPLINRWLILEQHSINTLVDTWSYYFETNCHPILIEVSLLQDLEDVTQCYLLIIILVELKVFEVFLWWIRNLAFDSKYSFFSNRSQIQVPQELIKSW